MSRMADKLYSLIFNLLKRGDKIEDKDDNNPVFYVDYAHL